MDRSFFRIMFVRSHAKGAARNQDHSDVPGMLARLGVNDIVIKLNRAHSAIPQKVVRLARSNGPASADPLGYPFYLPPPLAPRWTISSAFSMLSDPPTWLGGYSLNVWRKPPTRVTAGTIVQSFSPHQRPYNIP